MLSFKAINNLSRHIAYISDQKNENLFEYVYFTELKESEEESNLYAKEKEEFAEEIKKYIKNTGDVDDIQLKSEYKFNLICANKTKTMERECIYVAGKSGSGKSYFISEYLDSYSQLFPKNKIYYLSLNKISNDKSFSEELRKKIIQINLDTVNDVIDFQIYKNCIFIFDDILDVKPSIKLEDHYPKTKIEKMNLKERNDAVRQLNKRMENIIFFLKQSAISIHNLGRKNNISIISVFHKPKSGHLSSFISSESTSCVLYPHGIATAALKDYLIERLSLSREATKEILAVKTYQYSFLSVNTSGRLFYITPSRIKLVG